MLIAAMEISASEWYSDTGTTSHMTYFLGKLHEMQPYNGSNGTMVGNDEISKISHFGESLIIF